MSDKLNQLTPASLSEIPKYQADIKEMDDQIKKLRSGELNPDDFKKYRLMRGIYGQRQTPDIQMIRVKIPWGRFTAEQFETLADVADLYANEDRKGIAHITTRQAIQFHFVKLDQVPAAMTKLAEAGLTTREACSNTVRNISSDPLSGVGLDEVFDASPYAEATFSYFLRHSVSQDLPRKFKISFSSSLADRGLSLMHDVGAVATIKDGKRGFVLNVGGGLGPTPKLAYPLEDFTPAEDLLRSIEAVIFVFGRDWDYGRKYRNVARVKFLIEKIGIEEFRKRVFIERDRMKSQTYPEIQLFEETAPALASDLLPEQPNKEYQRWKETNVQMQKQKGFNAVTIRLHLGDINSKQMRALSNIVRKFSNGTARTTVQQNLVIRWVADAALYSLYTELSAIGLILPSAGRLADITSCPGADTCQLGIASSRGLAAAIGEYIESKYPQDSDMKDLQIKISGCPNSCGQHHIADIGFFGGSKSYGTHQVPTFTMLLGGHLAYGGQSSFGKQILRVPTKKGPEVVGKLLEIYKAGKKDSETFREFVARVGFDSLKPQLEPLTVITDDNVKDLSTDWDGQEFKVNVGKGECVA